MLTPMAGAEDRAVERAVRVAKERARDEVQLLIASGRKVMRTDGAADMTIADVLTRSGAVDPRVLPALRVEVRSPARDLRPRARALPAASSASPRRRGQPPRRVSKPGSTSCSPPGSNRGAVSGHARCSRGRCHSNRNSPRSSRRRAERSPSRSMRCSRPGAPTEPSPPREPARDALFIRALTWAARGGAPLGRGDRPRHGTRRSAAVLPARARRPSVTGDQLVTGTM